MTLKLPAWLLTEMHTAVQSKHPEEACGAVLKGKGEHGDVYDHHRIKNSDPEPRTRYSWDIEDHKRLYDAIDAMPPGGDIWVIYHSHTETAPEPSNVDRAAAWFAGVHYLIFSTVGGPEDVWYQSWICTEPGHLVSEEVVVL